MRERARRPRKKACTMRAVEATTDRPTGTWRHRLLVLSCLSFGLVACSDDGSNPTDPGGNGDPVPYDHALAPGASSADFLTSDDYDRLVVQVQYVEGHRPSDAGLQHLRDFLASRLNKPSGVTVQIGAPLQIQSQATYSAAEIRTLEQAHRTVFTEEGTLAAYLLFLDGAFAQADNVLGLAYNNTSMAIFQEKIEANTGGALQPSQSVVEGTVANHEVGHLLGLVNNGAAMVAPHQDPANGHHCDDEQCLMYYAVRTTDFLDNLLGGTVPSLDQDCLNDLQAAGGK